MRYTKKQFDADFPTEDVCLQTIFKNRYGAIKACPNCGIVYPTFTRVKRRKCYACTMCAHQLHPLAQTIFHKSKTPLISWFYAIYLFSVSKNGVSAKELERHLGVTYKTALRMAHRIRSLMATSGDALSGDIEIDEAYIGGRHQRRYGRSKKSVVFGAVERNGRAKVTHVKSSGSRVLLPAVFQGISYGSRIHSDEWRAYKSLEGYGYNHTTVNHSKLEYVRGDTHTNTIDGFWSQLKRSIDGTYHAVSPKYLQRYLDEFSFRYSYRDVVVYPVLLARAAKPLRSGD